MRAFVLSEKRRKKICAVELDLSCDKDTSTARITFQRQTANGSVCHYHYTSCYVHLPLD